MHYHPLIPSSPPVSEIGLGSWQLGQNSGWKNLSEQEAIQMVHKALDLGVNFFDTAPNYGLGTSESRLGKALQGIDRASFVVNTKFGHAASGQIRFEADAIRPSIEGSLERLQLDYLDSVILHNPPTELIDGTIRDHVNVFEQLKAEGIIRAYGASVDTAREMNLLMEHTGSEVMEVFFNILHQDTASAFDRARKQGVGIIAKIPLDSGWLSGKYDEHSTFEGIRSRWSREDIATRASLIRKLKELIGDDRELAQVALSFCLSFEAIATVIPGATSPDQLAQNLQHIEQSLPEALRQDLERFYREEVRDLGLVW